MYVCTDCKKRFFDPKIVFESHAGLPEPFERHLLCPYCGSGNIAEYVIDHCKYCGARLSDENHTGYCNGLCKARGERLKFLEAKRKAQRYQSPIYKAVRELIKYNKEHGTNMSYGQFISKNRKLG